MKLHLYAEEITPEYLKKARELARLIFKNKTCGLVIYNSLDKVLYEEVLTNEKEKEKATQKNEKTTKA